MKALNREINLQTLKADIRNKTREDLDEQQRNYFLQQQIKNLQAEMSNGQSSPEKEELLKKARNKKWPEDVRIDLKTAYIVFEKKCSSALKINDSYSISEMFLAYISIFP